VLGAITENRDVVTGVASTGNSSLVGRASELGHLLSLLDAVEQGEARILVLSGEPGIGKTRLLQSVMADAAERGFRVFAGRGTELEHEVPFAPLVEAFDDAVASLAGTDPAWLSDQLADLSGMFPSLRGPAVLSARSAGERFRHHRAIRALLEKLGDSGPLVLTIDDLQWADPASIEAIAYLLRYPPETAVLISVARRAGEAAGPLGVLLELAGREECASELALATLTEDEAGELLGDSPESTRSRIFEESGGNPFYIEQLLRLPVLEEQHRDSPAAAALDVPSGVARAIEQELRGLPAEARQMLGAAAVTGEPFDAELAAEVAGFDPEPGLTLLDQLVGRDLVRPQEDLRSFRFRHPLVRRAVYDALSPGQRLTAHRRAAVALEAVGAPPAATAHHYVVSARPGDERAISSLADAAETFAGAAPSTAADWLDRAIELLPGDQRARRLTLLGRLAQARMAAGDLNSAHTTLLQVVDELSADGGTEWIAAVTALASVELALGRQSGVRARVDDAMARAESVPAAALSPLLGVSVLEAAYSGEFVRAEHAARAAVETTADGPGTSRVLAHSLHALILQLQGDGRMALAEQDVAVAAQIFDALTDDDIGDRLELPWMLGMTEFQLERFPQAVRHLERGIAIAVRTADGEHLAQTRAFLAYSLFHLGRVKEAREVAAEGLEAARLLQTAAYSTWTIVVAALTWSVEDPRRALRLADEVIAMLPSLDDSMIFDTSHGHIGLICAEAGEFERAIEHIHVAGAPEFSRFGDPGRRCVWIEALTRSNLELGTLARARDWASRGEDLAAGLDLPVAEAAVKRARALVLLAEGEADAAAELAFAAAHAAEQRHARLEAWRSMIVAGRALGAAGRAKDAVNLLHQTRSALLAAGAGRLAQETGRELRKLGISVSAPVARRTGDLGTLELSKRELEVAAMVASGSTNPQIAQALYLSPKTIEGHMSRIFFKLGVSSRAEVAARIARTAKLQAT
jgi:DNA-binding NarL/FixJ family response regulator